MNKDKITIHPRGEDGHRSITLRLPYELLSQIDTIAFKTNRSRNDILNILLRNAVEIVEISDNE